MVMIKILKVEGSRVFVEIVATKAQIWLDKKMLRQYGVKSSDLVPGKVLLS
jgi:hypothetical protein